MNELELKEHIDFRFGTVETFLSDLRNQLKTFSESFASQERQVIALATDLTHIKDDISKIYDKVKVEDDYIWQELRRCQNDCGSKREKEKNDSEKMFDVKIKNSQLGNRLWLIGTTAAALGAMVLAVWAAITNKIFG